MPIPAAADGLPDRRKWYGVGQEPATYDPANTNWKGEDKNLNGERDQDADGNWTETDPLANDSDVDGILDGPEVIGSWTYKGGTAGGAALDPLNPDFDGDGLRDGQEAAGWMVGIWFERTMEKKINYSVTSKPWVVDTDGDTLTDFSEFMNGSDPRKLDTDRDTITDPQEVARKSNITGIEGTPPQITNVSTRVEVETLARPPKFRRPPISGSGGVE